jgi:Ice-binding-like
MNGSGFKAWTLLVAAVLAVSLAGCDGKIFGGTSAGGASAGNPGPAGAGPVLGLAAAYGIASTAGITNTGATTINGNVVLANPTPTCNAVAVPGGAGTAGFGLCGGAPPTLNGTVVTPISPDVTTATNVKAAMNTAFLGITPPAGPPAAGSRGGATNIPAGTTMGAPTGSALVQGTNYFVPGLYQSLTSILITGDLTLDAQGNPNAVFIFQSSSTVGTAAGARILLINGAKASNVYWQAASSATLGTTTIWQGNIFAALDITMNTGATSCGRLWAGAWVGGSGAFVFDTNVVSVPGSPSAPGGCV